MKSAKQKERELIISLHDKKKSTYQIAEILGISQTKASFWVRRYAKTGSLDDKSKEGRPTKLKKYVLKTLSKELLDEAKSDNRAGISSKKLLEKIEQKTGKKYTLRHAQRLLHKVGFSLITPRTHHIRKDVKAQQKFREGFKKNLNKNMWIIQS